MNINIHTQGFSLTPAISAYVYKRLYAALKPFAANVVELDVFLKDINGPKGGDDKVALIRARYKNRTVIAIEIVRADLYKAITLSVQRLKRSIRRTVSKNRRIEKQVIRRLQHDTALAYA